MHESLSVFFKQYINAFFQYNSASVQSYYQLPCTLNTPEQLVILTQQNINEELIQVFNELKAAKLSGMKIFNSSYDTITESLAVVNISWQLFTENDQLFTEFCALYHVIKLSGEWKIVNINSQALEQSIALTQTLDLS